MKVFVGYKFNLLISSLKSRGFLKTAQRFFRKWLYFKRGLPTYINIEITNRCNLSCPYCAASRDLMNDQWHDMSFDVFKKVIDDITRVPRYFPTLQLAFRGEPLLNNDICKITKYATDKGLFISISTNGLLLNKEINKGLIQSSLDYLTVSLDGTKKDTYESMRRGGDFNFLIKNIEDLVRQKKELNSQKPLLELQYVITKRNENEIQDFFRLAKAMKVDNIRFKTYKLTCLGRNEDSIGDLKEYLPKNNKYSRYIIKEGKIIPKANQRTCSWFSDCLIYADGNVGICCEDYNKKYIVGNVLQDSFWSVWNSASFTDLRKKIRVRGLVICESCG